MSSVAGSRTHFHKRDAKCSIRSFSSVGVEELEEKKEIRAYNCEYHTRKLKDYQKMGPFPPNLLE